MAPPPPPRGTGGNGVDRRIIAAVVAVALAIGGGLVAKSGSGGKQQSASGSIKGAPEIFLEPVADSGPGPFTSTVEQGPAPTTTTTAAPPTTAPGASSTTRPGTEATAIRGVSGSKPGLYGGTRSNSTCDRNQLITFLQANPAKAAAWAQVQGITPDQIPTFIHSLTPVRLQADTRVTNHGFANGKATPRQSVLQAGTAVLVDDRGEPRARCACGNPLRLPVAAQTAPTYTGKAWPGFSPAATTVVAPAPAPVQSFTLTDPATGAPFSRPAGTDGPADGAAALPPGGPELPTSSSSTTTTTMAPTTTTTAATTTTTRPTGAVMDVASEGTVSASSTYGANEYPTSLAVDGDATTSWFSAGPGKDGTSSYTWTGKQEDLIDSVTVLSNRLNQRPDFRVGFGFARVKIDVYAAATGGAPVFSQTVELPGSPDPDVTVQPNVRGRRIVLTFFGSEDPGCGGFAELQVGVVR